MSAMNKSEFDIDRAKRLVEEISENLAALPEDGAKYAQLRAEGEDLKAILILAACRTFGSQPSLA
jgi:hypothetical protein